MFIGTVYDHLTESLWPDAAKRLAGIGLKHLRVSIPADDDVNVTWQLRLNMVEGTLRSAKEVGITTCMNTMWMPPRASGYTRAYREGQNGLWLQDSFFEKDGHHLAGECADNRNGLLCETCSKDENLPLVHLANHPPAIDPDFRYQLGQRLARRFGSLVDEWADWNEPEISLFWPWIRLANRGIITREEAIVPLVRDIIAPFQTGVRSVIPDARFVGPESAAAGGLEEILIQAEKFGAWFDVVSVHPYAWPPMGAHTRAKEFIDVWQAAVNRASSARSFGAPLRFSEIDDLGIPGGINQFIRECAERYPMLDGIVIYPSRVGVQKRWFDADGKPTTEGLELLELTKEIA